MAGTSKYFYGHFEPLEWTSQNWSMLMLLLLFACVTSLMGQTTVVEAEIRSTKSKNENRNLIMLPARNLSFEYGHNYACQSVIEPLKRSATNTHHLIDISTQWG